MQEGSICIGAGPEPLSEATSRADFILKALGQISHQLLSDTEIETLFSALARALIGPGIETVAILALQAVEPRWQMRALCSAVDGGHARRRKELSAQILSTVSQSWQPDSWKTWALSARICVGDRRVIAAAIINDGAVWGLLWVRASEQTQPWKDEERPALERVALSLGRAMENRAHTIAMRQRVAQLEALSESGLAMSSSMDLQVESEIWEGMTRQGAMAFENARLYEEARQRMNELELVHQVVMATARVVDIDRLLRETTNFIAERIYPDVFGFVLRDPRSGDFRPHPSYHGLSEQGLKMAVPLDGSVTGHVARTGEAHIVGDVSKEPLYFSIVSETQSEIAVPMMSDEQVIGVINVESRKRHAFSEADLRFLMTLAGQVATAIERVQLYADLERYAEELAEEVDRRTLELKWERDRMLAILESAGEGILFTDVDAKIQYVNPALQWQTGYSRDECLGARPSLWRSPQTDVAVFEEMWDTLLSGRRWRGEMVNRRKNGTLFDAVLTITPLHDGDGKLAGFVGVQADISRLKEVDRLKSKFIANVSHELRTPLTNIRNYTSLLERGDREKRKKYMSVIKHESERLTRLIQDLLDLSRLEAKGPAVEMETIDVGALVEEMTTTFAAQAEQKRIALKWRVHEPLPDVLGSSSELQQVVGNLLGNAMAYTPEGGRVQVSAGGDRKDGREVVWIRVEDNGPGIEKAEIPRLFERFYRGEAARRSGVPGTGLGLAICKEILENYGGELALDSVPSEGTLFTVWLPCSNNNGSALP